ncbi:hypothetical protein TSUD_377070 [Trifolium subterraneum]|uniref:PB1-like domain-containing protein n=1 Tax=Trifolium subterraneum TaxID=3900 RepID=A0A2Z6MIA3_TRISU|nr:hypothetical protein TSUD_377070 [Trifolium subterraneum]
MCVWDKLEADFLNKFDLEAMVKKCGRYFNISHIWYLLPEMTMFHGLRKLVNDKDYLDMVFVAMDNNNEIELYFEHGVEVPQFIAPTSDVGPEVEVQHEPEVEVQDEPEVEGQVSDAKTEVDVDYDAKSEEDSDSNYETDVDGDSDAENANLDASFL